jgi:hypothetical protein
MWLSSGQSLVWLNRNYPSNIWIAIDEIPVSGMQVVWDLVIQVLTKGNKIDNGPCKLSLAASQHASMP